MRTAFGLLSLVAGAAAFSSPARRITAITTAPARTAPAHAVAAPARPATALRAGTDDEEKRLPWFFDPGTYGGVIVLTIFLIVAPLALKSALEA